MVDGTHIAPAEGAEQETYDPLEQYRSAWEGRKRKGNEPPYLQFARLATAGPEECLEWCERFGLLGILLERTVEVRFWPYWAEPEGNEGVTESELVPVQVRWRQIQAAGSERSEYQAEEFESVDWEQAAAHRPVSKSVLSELIAAQPLFGRGIASPGVTVSDRGGPIREESVTEGYAKFFPRYPLIREWLDGRPLRGVPHDEPSSPFKPLDRGFYPEPGTETFRRQYGEPIGLIRHWAEHVAEILRLWKHANTTEGLKELLSESGSHPREAYQQFKAGLHSVRPSARLTEEAGAFDFYWHWDTHALYGLLQIMILEDFPLKERSLRRCRKCDSLFATDNSRQRYCTDNCQRAAEMARYRERKREAEDKNP